MRRPLTVVVTAVVLAAGLAAPAAAAPAAAPAAVVHAVPGKAFSSCAKLNATYKGGVAKNAKVKNTKTVKGKKVRAKQRYAPKVSASLYAQNRKLDRDKDGIACER
ncbi:excalibur calcium-binding domain-containing protein [Cellulomonas massiliensis]|uniref:excalibur calcium-binding domain-containing protein n=1 Tax=Cellulomonas massiliensis TaxID=1465811 RepID=UPI00031B50C5|nr:excalibur calcium-binding domain-containing protein [Cellulomonas massiliensis]